MPPFLQDYGGPVGFRMAMAMAKPQAAAALIMQNGNAHEEGLDAALQELPKATEELARLLGNAFAEGDNRR